MTASVSWEVTFAAEIAAAMPLLVALRERLFDHIRRLLEEDGHCKSYEGTFTIILPNYFTAAGAPERFGVKLDCYLIGPHRHYDWWGPSLEEAVEKARKDIDGWIQEYDHAD